MPRRLLILVQPENDKLSVNEKNIFEGAFRKLNSDKRSDLLND